IVTLVLVKRTNDAQESVVQALTSATVQAMGQAVEREISGMMTTLRVLSSDEALLDGDFARFHERSLMALAGSGSYLFATDDQFQQLLNTRLSFGTPLPVTADPQTAGRALARRAATVSDLFFGPIANTWVFNIWRPVEAGNVTLLALTQNARDLVPVMQSRELPTGWHAALVDGGNRVISATPDAA